MNLLYRIAIALITYLLPLAGLFSAKINHFLKGRKGLQKKLLIFRSKNSGNLAWFHVASLGEYEQAKPVIAKLKLERPSVLIVVSFFSPSGYDIATRKTQVHVDYITYLPLDRKSWAFDFVKTLNPSIAFFAKYDLWYHHILALSQNNVPIILFSASFRPTQEYFKSDGFFRSILFKLDQIFTQNQGSLDLLDQIGYAKGLLAGDTRFDRVMETARSPKTFPEIESWVQGKKVMVLGSVWEEDMKIVIPLINQVEDYLWIIAPHDLSPEPMDAWANSIRLPSIKYSETKNFGGKQVLFIDNIGMLSSLYQYGDLAYVGGAFGKGLHNILEPLGFGIPVLFGSLKNTAKFPESEQSVNEGCGFSVNNTEELKEVFEKMQVEEYYQSAIQAANLWVSANLGAAEKIINRVLLNYPLNGR
ncbi:3-deoxy-D-manno-octulosonic acid transferase [Algoriphagus lutimaris]|uniref:3-deoxy-D-manno-octulosonic acid transferase n=1 Tax=Algoriphagus lutimaris TaxID=613197 RepID=UPI00196B15B7|nr:glycosyltransferase N-terminal domain-containing protein [Algoriphagus lutimaris]MBN3520560.1 3-deoxy-D-manno-octulosonic acid transferase [Algoriphagus lutimaris]